MTSTARAREFIQDPSFRNPELSHLYDSSLQIVEHAEWIAEKKFTWRYLKLAGGVVGMGGQAYLQGYQNLDYWLLSEL